MKRILIFLCCLIFFISSSANSTDVQQFQELNSQIKINNDLSADIREDITVIATNYENQGLTIWLPVNKTTTKRHEYWDFEKYQIQQILLDNDPIPYTTEQDRAYNRLGIQTNNTLSSGEHTFSFRWHESNVATYSWRGEFSLIRNLTNINWGYPVDSMTAILQFPNDTQIHAYILNGQSDWTHPTKEQMAEHVLNYRSYTRMPPGAEVWIGVKWTRDWAQTPGWQTQWNKCMLFTGLALFYYILAWLLSFRPTFYRPTMFRSTPPDNVSPAALCYLCDTENSFAAATLNLAIKDAVTIEKDATPIIRINETNVNKATTEELTLVQTLQNVSSLNVNSFNQKTIAAISKNIQTSLKKQFRKIWFNPFNHLYYLIPGLILSALAIWFPIQSGIVHSRIANVLSGLSIFFLIIVYTLDRLRCACIKLMDAFTIKAANQAIILIAIIAFLFYTCIINNGMRFFPVEITQAITFHALVFVNCLFIVLFFRKPTVVAIRLKDQAKSFKSFLMQKQTQNSFELFEKYLPYAVALDVEKQWANQFASLPKPLPKPSWYIGSWPNDINLATFSVKLSDSLSFI